MNPSRKHPPSLRTFALAVLREEKVVTRGETLLCACSGGPDSTALLHVLALLRKRRGFELVAHGVDHGLRPEAAAELGLAAELCAKLGVPFDVTRVDVLPGPGVQARAREARLTALAAAARRADAKCVATGHTADDRAETFLMRMLRGAGPRGLAVMPPSSPWPQSEVQGASAASCAALLQPRHGPEPAAVLRLVRPLIRARRSDVMQHIQRHGLRFATDPSNRDERYFRTRVRQELVPLVESLAPRAVEHIVALADMLEDADSARRAEIVSGDEPAVELRRAHRLALARARRLGRPRLELRLSGGAARIATFAGDQIVLTSVEPPRTDGLRAVEPGSRRRSR